MYEVRCFICTSMIRSAYWEDVEDHIMACRERAPTYKRGDLKDFKGTTIPNAVDTSGVPEYATYI